MYMVVIAITTPPSRSRSWLKPAACAAARQPPAGPRHGERGADWLGGAGTDRCANIG